jgi:hypothetical protein
VITVPDAIMFNIDMDYKCIQIHEKERSFVELCLQGTLLWQMPQCFEYLSLRVLDLVPVISFILSSS